MLLRRWLRALIPRKPSRTGAPPPPRGEGWRAGPVPTTPIPPTSDTSHRIHIAANDPAFATKREAAVALICQAITDIATPMGYTCKGTTWTRTTDRGKSAVHLQRNRYGFTATIIMRFLTPDGNAPNHGAWAQDDDIGLQLFHVPNDGTRLEDGVLTYLDVYENAASLALPMHILATRALPWLDAHHAADHPKTIPLT